VRTARVTLAARFALFALAATVTAVALTLVARNTNTRIDLTLSGSHRLGERTVARLDALDQPLEIVLAVDRARLDRRARDRVEDALASFAFASDLVTATVIDTGSPAGPDQFRALLDRLAEREAPARRRRAAIEQDILDRTAALAERLPTLDAAVRSAAEIDPAGGPRLAEIAAFVRVAARQLAETSDAPAPPGPSSGADAADLASDVASRLGTIAGELAAAQPDAPTDEARLRLRDAERLASELRGAAAVAGQLGAALAPLDLERVEGALNTGEAALVIGPPRDGAPGLVAIDLNELLPPPAYFRAAGAAGESETAARAERLFTSALTVLTDPARPIVVFVHGEIQRWVGRAGIMTGLLERLARSGVDHAEWAPVVDETPPDLSEIDPTGERPVVYVIISPDSSATSTPGNPASRPGVQRAEAVGRTLASLLERGEAVLVNLNPSVFPTFGDADPIAAPLAGLGIAAASGTPILRTTQSPTGPAATVSHRLVPAGGAQAITGAVAGLPLALDWPVPLEISRGAAPLLVLDDPGAWAEDDWLGFWRTPRNQRPLITDQPAFDDADETRGPWTIAAAARGESAAGARSRAVVVGANAWFLDRMWRSQQLVGGRPVLTHPGNAELFDAAILWLAGRDELIVPSPTARPVARLKPISTNGLLALRWGLIAGLPLGVLVVGGLVLGARR
jgi:hypothetical protein